MATPQQERIRKAAEELLAAIRECVPDTTHHWAVRQAEESARRLARLAGSIRTNDGTGWEY